MYLDLNLEPTEEQAAFRGSAPRFALELLRPRTAELNRRPDAPSIPSPATRRSGTRVASMTSRP